MVALAASWIGIPSGKHTKNYGKSQFSMGESTINGHFQWLCDKLPEGTSFNLL